jgi:outer membrane biosynthesis protein TonB
MMPSVIPARLQFQCGHAALVTLPRVKGETATQRNDRVAREKTAALARQCDFCAPSVAVAVVEPQLAAGNGSHVNFALSDVAEPTSVTDLVVVVTNESDAPTETEQTPPEAMDTEPAIVATEPDAVEPEPAEPVTTPPAPEEPLAAPKPARNPRARRQATQPTPRATPAPARPTRARRAPARLVTPRRAPAVTGQRFVVEYRVERVVGAANIRDALRQAAALGAADVVAITRED